MLLFYRKRVNRKCAKRIVFLCRGLQLSAVMVASFLCIMACSESDDQSDSSGNFVALINGQALTREELSQMIPPNVSKQDSAALAKEYIYSWACDQLMFDQATWNKSSNEEIERKVEQYRKQLIVYEYERRLIEEEFSNSFSLDKITGYLSSLTEKPKAKERYAKGVLLIVPSSAEHIAQMRRFVALKKADDVENLEKYCHQIGVTYRLFVDQWQKMSDIVPILSEAGFDGSNVAKAAGSKEVKVDGKILFLTLTDVVLPGDDLPETLAEEVVKEEFERAEQVKHIQEYRKQLFDKAVEKRELILRD